MYSIGGAISAFVPPLRISFDFAGANSKQGKANCISRQTLLCIEEYWWLFLSLSFTKCPFEKCSLLLESWNKQFLPLKSTSSYLAPFQLFSPFLYKALPYSKPSLSKPHRSIKPTPSFQSLAVLSPFPSLWPKLPITTSPFIPIPPFIPLRSTGKYPLL